MSQPKQQPNDMEVDDEDVVETNAEVMNVDVVQQPPAEAGTCTMNIAGSSGAGPVINENAGSSNAARVMASSGTIGSVSKFEVSNIRNFFAKTTSSLSKYNPILNTNFCRCKLL